jgi:ribosomal protein S18 acetylase RimI-like enzyme
MNIQILPISKEYIEGYYNCLDSVARERLYLILLESPHFDLVQRFVEVNIAQDAPHFVAVNDNIVVGWCDIVPKEREGFTHCGILGMGVHRNFRRCGFGLKLVNKAINKAKEIGLERIELEVFASNEAAIKLYKKVGFVVEGVKKNARKLDGVYDDLVCMALLVYTERI